MAGTRLDHVRANVTDLNAAIERYTTILGFEVEAYCPPEAPNYAHFTTASGATFAVMEAEGRGGRFNFTIADPRRQRAGLRPQPVATQRTVQPS